MERANAHFVECGGNTRSVWVAGEEGSAGDYTEFFVGINQNPAGNIVVNATTESAIDTTWGDSGYFSYTNPDSGDGSTNISTMVQMGDGRMLIAGDNFIYGSGWPATGYDVFLTMVNIDGTIDTTWGSNPGSGFWGLAFADDYLSNVEKIILDDDENIYVFGQSHYPPTVGYSIYKLNSSGTLLARAQTGVSALYVYMDACWANDAKTKILCVGASTYFNGQHTDMTMINASDLSLDDTWTGNLGTAGQASYPTGAGQYLRAVKRMSDNGYVVYESSGSPPYFHKIISDGSAYDTTWGTNGKLDIGTFATSPRQNMMCQDGDTLYTITYNGSNKAVFSVVDSTGTVTQSHTTDVSSGGYLNVTMINNYLYFGRGNTPVEDVEKWTLGFDYISGFDCSSQNVWFILPDEETRLTTEATEGYVTTEDIGYSHLEGETVGILADGVVYDDQVVTDGEIDDTDFADATEVHVGLKYMSKLRPMKPLSHKAMMRKKATCKQMGISVHNTDDIEYGVSDDDMKAINFDEMKNKCDIDGLFTGTVAVSVPDGFSVNMPLQISTDAPLPAVIRAMIPKVDVTGD